MEVKATTIFGAILAAMLVVQAMAIPLSQGDVGQSGLPADKRPKYMETRDLSAFKAFLLASINDLIEEGVLSSRILAEPKSDEVVGTPNKRAHLSLCFGLTPSGNPVAKPCWTNRSSRSWW